MTQRSALTPPTDYNTGTMKLHPFKALRPPRDKAAEVASVPYDVVDTDEARTLAAGQPESFLHVIRPEIELPEGTDLYSDAVYAKGVENLERFIREVPFTEEAEPSLYVYRLRMEGRNQIGVVGCCAVDEYDADLIKKHERTRKAKEDDRTRHVVEMRCQAEPIFLAFRDSAGVSELMTRTMKEEPLYDFLAVDGVGHSLWRVSDPAAYVEAFEKVPCLYVADGHHRSASASRARAELRDRNPAHTGEEEYNRVMAVMFPSDQLRILAYNRVVKDLAGRSPQSFREELDRHFPLTEGASPAPESRGEFRMYLVEDGVPHWYGFSIRPPEAAGVIESLDVSLLQDNVLAPLLQIDDPRTSDRIDFVGGIRGTEELERRVRSGRDAVAFSLHPTSLDELMAVADAGEVMPPKSTWFEPKLRSGLFLHRI